MTDPQAPTTKGSPKRAKVGRPDPQAPTTEAGRRLVSEPEWSDKEHRRAIALAIEAEARAAALAPFARGVIVFESREALTAALAKGLGRALWGMGRVGDEYAAAIVAEMLPPEALP